MEVRCDLFRSSNRRGKPEPWMLAQEAFQPFRGRWPRVDAAMAGSTPSFSWLSSRDVVSSSSSSSCAAGATGRVSLMLSTSWVHSRISGEIGRASCRERVEMSVGAGCVQKEGAGRKEGAEGGDKATQE